MPTFRRLGPLLALALVPALALAAVPQRICSLSLAGDEMLARLVPVSRVVCVSSFVDDPELSNAVGVYPKSVPRLAARIEPVLGAEPDLVIVAPWNDPSVAQTLGRAGIATHVIPDANTFPAILAAFEELGRRVGEAEKASTLVAQYERELADLDRKLAGIERRPRVLSFSHLIVAGKNTTVDALIRRAGGTNAAAELGIEGHKQVTLEQIIALDPDWLLFGFDPGEKADALLAAYPLLRETRAAKAGRVIVLAPRELTTVSPTLIDGAVHLARVLHPERFAAAQGAR